MVSDDVRTILVNLPISVRGFCYFDSEGMPCIVLNARLSEETRRKAFRHEMNHIRSGDIDNKLYHEYSEVIHDRS